MPETALNPAEEAAERTRQRIYKCIDDRKHFLVEAGAGAGKTYSLINALRYLTETQGRRLIRRHQRVACITFTNVATDEIRSRTDRHAAIQSDTIHSFSWSIIKPFQPALRKYLPSLRHWPERLEAAGGLGNRTVDYNLGYPAVEDSQVLLHHNDVLALMVALLGEPKFRQLVADRYPILLIDEYQDTDSDFAEAILKHFVTEDGGPLVGFFGDHWQKIYGNGCGHIENARIEVIGKEANFRSAPAIVNVLNRMRPELPQEVTNPHAAGSAHIFHTNAWRGQRLAGSHSKGDLPAEISHAYLERLRLQLGDEGWDLSPQACKILMLTHRLLASEQGYAKLATIFPRTESYIQKEDPHIAFFLDAVEPVCRSYVQGRFGEMFSAVGARRPVVCSHADKVQWKQDMERLIELRATGNIGEVIDHLGSSRLGLPNAVQRREASLGKTEADTDDADNAEFIKLLREVAYQEVVALAKFVDGQTPFETKHGVKGAEFENVLVVVGRGWNHYDFNQMLELMEGAVPVNRQAFFERNRNLFYVACSRPKRRLAVLFTQELSAKALSKLAHLFGPSSVIPLPEIPEAIPVATTASGNGRVAE